MQAATCPQLPPETWLGGKLVASGQQLSPPPESLKARRGWLHFFHRGHRLSGLYYVWLVPRHFLFRLSHSSPPRPRLLEDWKRGR